MAERSIEHASFTLERRYEASPAKVFSAWADPEAKARWFSGPEDWEREQHELDFRIGGRERSVGGPKGGPVSTYTAVYWDIVPDERIVYTYEMLLDGTRVSVSLATITLREDGEGTILSLTEHGAFLDGADSSARREQGTVGLLEQLARALQGETA
jgi:uncharacterized protein YndB with AHSA1/START domain